MSTEPSGDLIQGCLKQNHYHSLHEGKSLTVAKLQQNARKRLVRGHAGIHHGCISNVRGKSHIRVVARECANAAGVAASILEGFEEMLTVSCLGLPAKLRRSLPCINSIATVRRFCRNLKRWRNAAMAWCWTAAA
jgi:hypothetical protein